MGSVPLDRPLAGRAVFLSASVPSRARAERYHLVPGAGPRLEEAALRVAGAVFQAGGTLVFGGHPSISPLIGYLCTQYQRPAPAEPDRPGARSERPAAGPEVVLWQSEAFRDTWAEPSRRLATMPGVTVRWTAAIDGERFDASRLGSPHCQKSLAHMRAAMIEATAPVAMVAIGGMEGIEDEFEIFRRLRETAPVYALPSTGGAARILAENHPNSVRSFDAEVREHVREFRRRVRAQDTDDAKESPSEPAVRAPDDEEIAIPYANVAARIVEDIAERCGADH